MKTFFKKLDRGITPLRKVAMYIGAPVWDLAARLYLGWAFFKSGMLRFADYMNGNFSNQIFLFELEHPVPFLSPEIAAYGATAGELILPVLLVLGLFSRFAAAGLLIMTAIIELTYIHSLQHILWAFLGASIFVKGGGRLALDYYILKYLHK